MIVFDIETNGLLPQLEKVHTICAYDTETERHLRFNDQPEPSDGSIEDGVHLLNEASDICGHYICGFDVLALQKVFPWFQPKGKQWDTKVMSSVIYPNRFELDCILDKKGKGIPKNLMGRHSLEAWGHRLGEYKDDYKQVCQAKGIDPWAEWNIHMEDYCEQDVAVTAKLIQLLLTKVKGDEAWLDLEHHVCRILAQQEQRGFAFDEQAAAELYAKLSARRAELERELKDAIPPFFKPGKEFTPKANSKRYGYVKGSTFTKVTLTEFNPASDQHIARYLQGYGWKPKEFTPGGQPVVSEYVLSGLTVPHVKTIREHKIVEKRIGQLAEGKEAWLKRVRNGRIHGRVNQNGAVTGRMTHSSPNIAQVPANRAPYGKECRSLFKAGDGYVLVGCDADGLELRALAHFMAAHDGGEYAKTVVEGNKEDGTDAHTVNQKAVGLNSRDSAKTWFYAFIYGAGDMKLGSIVWEDMKDKPKPTDALLRKLGKQSRSSVESNLPALGKLIERVKKAAGRGYLKGIDGRRIPIRSEHAALNTLLQSAGAIVMKKALSILDFNLTLQGYTYGKEYAYVANVHDEFQLEALPEVSDEIGRAAAAAIRGAGESFGFRCPLSGSYEVGSNWAETH